MNNAKAYKEVITIPTYGTGKPNKNPMFFEKRVYQASSGKVYPYAIVDTLTNKKEDKQYQGVYLENDFIKVLILPEIGGKIHRAIDKTTNQDFLYHNEVIKPALVGLLGPWVSGGIEFNWPQHHRPTTYMKCECKIIESSDGSVSAKLYDYDRMYGTSVVTTFTLFKDKSYIQVNARLFNPTSESQTFLWWANPAVGVNDDTQSIFPPDVNAVFDHGKRAVSKFPIATGEYYKYDYGMGVDISRYKNIPVPTSYMAYKSKYDFVGHYDYGTDSGLLHVANHHISPGKKQWTWGNGDFGQAWDRNLTDENGPYIELMTGVYTDNQPDFSWLKPYEEKEFTQYFMPYKKVGAVKNASKDYIINLENTNNETLVKVYSTGENEVLIKLTGEKVYLEEKVLLTPQTTYHKSLDLIDDKSLTLQICDLNGKELLSYIEEEEELKEIPNPQNPAQKPEEIKTIEELYITGQHIEQYRHATFIADNYYLEGLKRDPGDTRCNNAIGLLSMRRGQFEKAEKYFSTAIDRLTKLHPNPYDSEAYTNLGFALMYQNKKEEAYEAFYKATWVQSEAAIGFYQLALLETSNKNYTEALPLIDKAIQYNSKNYLARALKVYLLMNENRNKEANLLVKDNLKDNPYDFISNIFYDKLNNTKTFVSSRITTLLNVSFFLNYIGESNWAFDILNEYTESNIMIEYYKAFSLFKAGKNAKAQLEKAKETKINAYFPSSVEDQIVLQFVAEENKLDYKALYLLGNIYYANTRYEDAFECWNTSKEINSNYASVRRNLSILLFNKKNNIEDAVSEIETAFELDKQDARTFFELDQMYKKLNKDNSERLALLENHMDLVLQRDDLKCEYVTLLNLEKKHDQAYAFIMENKFNPWEGGEGLISTQYVIALRELAIREMQKESYKSAINLLTKALVFPINLGEGKLEGDKSNDIYYYLGLAQQALNKEEDAMLSFKFATLGNDEPGSMLYYYDQSPDMIYYKGLAYLKLNNEFEAKKCFNSLIDYGERHYFDHIELDYFAVSIPDLQLFEDDLDLKNKVHCNFLLALGYLGIGDERSKKHLNEVIKKDKSHFRAELISK